MEDLTEISRVFPLTEKPVAGGASINDLESALMD